MMRNSAIGLVVLFTIFYGACKERIYTPLEGETMGTSYHITYHPHTTDSLEWLIRDLLFEINDQVSTYLPESTISLFNRGAEQIEKDKSHFWVNLETAASVFRETGGYFDPTVMPLVNYWGFGYTGKKLVTAPDSAHVDALHLSVGMDKLKYNRQQEAIIREHPDLQLDFSAIAKGYAVDQVADLLKKNKASDFMVEIGGEVRTRGVNPSRTPWRLAINTPLESAGLWDIIDVVELSGKSMATSGNYRNYYEINGQKYGHTLDPKTGYPAKNKLLAVTVIAESCILADAYATACLAMGYDNARDFIDSKQNTEAAFYLATETDQIQKIFTDGFILFLQK